MKQVLCIGHSAYDITMQVEEYPKENSKVRIGKTISCAGGAATNAGILLSKWGYDTYLASVVGNDDYAKAIEKELSALGIHLDYFQISNTFDTTVSYILASRKNGSRTIVVSRTKQTEMEDVVFEITPDAILLDGEELNLSLKALEMFPNSLSILDAGSLKPNMLLLASKVDYCITSKDFLMEYCKISEPLDQTKLVEGYEKMKKDFGTSIIVTLGEEGSFTKDEQGYHLVPSIKVDAIDTTGCGDLYHGAFLYFMKEGYPLLESMRYANITGALAARGLGRINSVPSLQEVLEKSKEDASL